MPDDTVLLERHFDTAFAAPDGIQKLRELILTLAMQGKLVPQDPNDQPASELLRAIEAEKQRLVKEGKIKQSKPLTKIKLEEIPYELLKEWEWVRLEDVSTKIHYGYTASANHDLKDVRLLRITDIQDNKVDWESVPGCEIKEKDVTQYLLANKDILIARTGGTVGKSYLVENISVKAVFASYLIRVVPSERIDVNYLKLFIECPLYWKQLYAKCSGTGQPNVNGTSLSTLLLPLPPLAEQHRIVTKIDRLMARCDELEKLRADRNQKRITIHTAALDRLLTAKESSDFSTAWRFITQHFGELYSVKENVVELRKAILQLAVMGKLVDQDQNDDQASDLLNKIRTQVNDLVRQRKERIVGFEPINVEDETFPLPENWLWVRLGSLLRNLRYGTSKKCAYDSPGTAVLRIPNIDVDNGRIHIDDLKYTNLFGSELQELYLKPNDLLMIRSNGSKSLVGRTAVVSETEEGLAYAGYLVRLRSFPECVYSRYLCFALSTVFVREQIERPIRTTSGVKNINSTEISNLVIPFPPLAEQRRIVAKTDQLMALCDRLEQQIDAATSKRTELLKALMAQV